VIYLTVSDVVGLSEAEVGPDILVDLGLLESAVLRPQQTVAGQDAYPDIHTKAAALMHSLIRNQGAIVALAVDVAEGVLDVAAISKTLKGWARQLELPDE
jgi:death-on-curing protein